jgi:hypothetical protein
MRSNKIIPLGASVLLFVALCVSLFFGTWTLFAPVPRALYEPYWKKERILYGLLPTAASVILAGCVSWLWTRIRPADVLKVTRTVLSLAIIAVVSVSLVLILIAGFRQP